MKKDIQQLNVLCKNSSSVLNVNTGKVYRYPGIAYTKKSFQKLQRIARRIGIKLETIKTSFGTIVLIEDGTFKNIPGKKIEIKIPKKVRYEKTYKDVHHRIIRPAIHRGKDKHGISRT